MPTRQDILKLAKNIKLKQIVNLKLSKGWLDKFERRNKKNFQVFYISLNLSLHDN